ncbi:hypothetical protein HCA61_13995 [Rhodococcus sp. HNM0563]|uniref:hypothetical protein n=1 Tax=unclassified Rhodococcus (in: high G+C Gram-positive bacteria) TaxID=192944 RepID=UPI00146F371F|nr:MULTISPECIES: hypothetical protein [unclassified Rhodococcus (in: high G+C Gram-positive bacteria)]MCK0092158.1 hypothetical protein [Rhodococcus sp. F64268]NLU63374.1 hypothetical protein [Rhodococcus sp. HNM0563]
MTTRHSARIAALAGLSAATILGVTGTAAADHTDYMIVPGHTHTLGEGNDPLCAGQITTSIRSPHDHPGAALVSMTFAPYLGTASGGKPTCAVTALVNWNNLDTGASGSVPEYMVNHSRGLAPSRQDGGYVDISTGPGRVLFSVATTSLHHVVPAPLEVFVP